MGLRTFPARDGLAPLSGRRLPRTFSRRGCACGDPRLMAVTPPASDGVHAVGLNGRSALVAITLRVMNPRASWMDDKLGYITRSVMATLAASPLAARPIVI